MEARFPVSRNVFSKGAALLTNLKTPTTKAPILQDSLHHLWKLRYRQPIIPVFHDSDAPYSCFFIARNASKLAVRTFCCLRRQKGFKLRPLFLFFRQPTFARVGIKLRANTILKRPVCIPLRRWTALFFPFFIEAVYHLPGRANTRLTDGRVMLFVPPAHVALTTHPTFLSRRLHHVGSSLRHARVPH